MRTCEKQTFFAFSCPLGETAGLRMERWGELERKCGSKNCFFQMGRLLKGGRLFFFFGFSFWREERLNFEFRKSMRLLTFVLSIMLWHKAWSLVLLLEVIISAEEGRFFVRCVLLNKWDLLDVDKFKSSKLF